MDKETINIKAACHCGNFKLEVPVLKTSLPLSGSICHCNPCRRSSGALCKTYCHLPDGQRTPDPAVIDRLKGYESSSGVTRYFCPTCSCHIYFHSQRGWSLATGCLERVEDVVDFTEQIFIEDTLDGGFSDWLTDSSLQRSATLTGHLEPGWRHPSVSQVNRSIDRLHAHCQCDGVSFYIARPSPDSEKTSAPAPDVLVPENSGPASLEENETWWLRANKQKYLGGLCACDSCRLMNGFEFIEWAFIPVSDISLDAEGKVPFVREFGTLQAYRSSERATKRFCSRCGATVFWDGYVRPGLIDVAAGLLDAPEGARAESWLEWMTERVSYREDAEPRAKSLLEAVEKDLSRWGKKVQGRTGPNEGFLQLHDGKLQ